MNLGEFKKWANTGGREVFTEHSDEILWAIREIARLEKALAETERMWREEKAKNKETL